VRTLIDLGRSDDDRAKRALLELLRRTTNEKNPEERHLAYQAVVALSDFAEAPDKALELASRSRSDDVRVYVSALIWR
jgi:hypothetical protein